MAHAARRIATSTQEDNCRATPRESATPGKAFALVPEGDIVAELRCRRAECYLLLGRPQDAFEEAKTGLEHCRDLGDRYEEAATYRVLALSAAALGNASEAKRWFDQA